MCVPGVGRQAELEGLQRRVREATPAQVVERRLALRRAGQDLVVEGDRPFEPSRRRFPGRPRARCGDSSTPARRPGSQAPREVIPSRSMTKVKMSPPRPQPKQCHVSRGGVTTKLGVFSPWNGQRPLKVVPAFFRETDSPTTSRTDNLLLTSAVTPTDKLVPRSAADQATPLPLAGDHPHGRGHTCGPVKA